MKVMRNIIEINEELCNGCEICVNACHEGAIQMINGKAKLVSDSYCDGLGDCLPECPTGAIKMTQKEVVPFDVEAVTTHMKNLGREYTPPTEQGGGCPSSQTQQMKRSENSTQSTVEQESMLSTWPVQIKLVNPAAPFLQDADLLIAADCTAFAYADFHQKFLKEKICLIGCPKLDEGDYADKLQMIFEQNNIRSLTVLRMEVPCCGGIEHAAKTAVARSQKDIPTEVITVKINGNIL